MINPLRTQWTFRWLPDMKHERMTLLPKVTDFSGSRTITLGGHARSLSSNLSQETWKSFLGATHDVGWLNKFFFITHCQKFSSLQSQCHGLFSSFRLFRCSKWWKTLWSMRWKWLSFKLNTSRLTTFKKVSRPSLFRRVLDKSNDFKWGIDGKLNSWSIESLQKEM